MVHCINENFQKNGFRKYRYEHALYVDVNVNGDIMFICLYIDDFIFTNNNHMMFEDFKKKMTEEFQMTNFKPMSQYHKFEVKQKMNGFFLP